MERDEREIKRSLSTPGEKGHRLARVRWYGKPSRMSAVCYENGRVVTRLFSLIPASRRFGGSLPGTPLGRRISHRCRVLTSSFVIVVRQQRQLASSMHS